MGREDDDPVSGGTGELDGTSTDVSFLQEY